MSDRMSDEAYLFRELKSLLATDAGRQRFCDCVLGVGESLMDGGLRLLVLKTMPYQAYLRTSHWRDVSRRAKERARHRCQLCNSPDHLETHHRTYENRGMERDEDLTVLCDHCHGRFHREPPSEEPTSEPALTEEQEVAWLQETVSRKRAEQGIDPQSGQQKTPSAIPIAKAIASRRSS